MGRDFQINGETLVKVKGGAHTTLFHSGNISMSTELGLASEYISIVPRWMHDDIKVDDFGPDIPAEVMSNLADVTIKIPFIHYDKEIMDMCLAESMGGSAVNFDTFDFTQTNRLAGVLAPAGTLLGSWNQLHSSGCHYMSLNFYSPQLNYPLRCLNCYMTGPPMEMRMGTEATLLNTTWRAIPYRAPTFTLGGPDVFGNPTVNVTEMSSSGVIIFDAFLDT